jgi:hypothetical protein
MKARADDIPVSWRVLASVFGGILLTVLAWQTSRAVTQLEQIKEAVVVAVHRIEDHERRIGNLETLYLKREQ